jgi:hypothetical protein
LPGHRLHRFHDREVFGKSYWRVHVKMDEPYLFLGSRHRVLFHDPISAAAIARQLYPNDPRAVEAAFGHIVLDWMCSNDPFFKARLELLAERDAQERARIRRQRKIGRKKRSGRRGKSRKRGRRRLRDPFKEVEEFVKKVRDFVYWSEKLSE